MKILRRKSAINTVMSVQNPDLTVTSEERVLDAILLWCADADDVYGWEVLDGYLESSNPERLFGGKIQCLSCMLSSVRFALMPMTLLDKVLCSVFSF